MSRLPLIWKLLLVPVFAILSFSIYLVYSSLVLSSSKTHLYEIRNIQFTTLAEAEENIDRFEKIIDALNTAAASGETDALIIAKGIAATVRDSYLKLQRMDTADREEVKRLASEFDAYFSSAFEISHKMATKYGMPDIGAVQKMRAARDNYFSHMAAFRSAAEQRFEGMIKETTDNAERARILGPVIGIIMLLVLIGLTLVVTRGILALEKQIVSINEETQQRIGQELHDDLGQNLTGIAFKSESLSQNLKSQGNPDFMEASKITALINEAIIKTRSLAHSLYPVEMKESGLPAMLRHLANHVESVYQIECSLICNCEENACAGDQLAMINLFRIAQEAVNNATKHSGATKITLRMESRFDTMVLKIDDNGCGINKLVKSGAKGGLGMRIMQYRADLLGATMQVVALPSGGTRVGVKLPLP